MASSAPYLPDGRAPTLAEAILLHGGEAKGVTRKFEELPAGDREAIVAFLQTLKAPAAVGNLTAGR